MEIQRHFSLRNLNTFGIDLPAAAYIAIYDKSQLPEISALSTDFNGLRILGGGSNILLTKRVDQLVVHNQLSGIKFIRETDTEWWVEVGAGENWHQFVLYTLQNGLFGVENLSLIPGKVGASPMQNIGAYGVEVNQYIEEVHAWHWEEAELKRYTNQECHFGYRDSIFKRELKDRVLVTSVVFRLKKTQNPQVSYGSISSELKKMGISRPTSEAVSNAVIRIRQAKLPNPQQIGNAGSFFKNPILSKDMAEDLFILYPDMPSFPADGDSVKIPAAWLIEKNGWKGHRENGAGVHDRQPLVLINTGNATGKDILRLSEKIITSVHERFGVQLEREVNIW